MAVIRLCGPITLNFKGGFYRDWWSKFKSYTAGCLRPARLGDFGNYTPEDHAADGRGRTCATSDPALVLEEN